MKAEKRNLYVVLSEKMGAELCTFCQHSEWEGGGSICDGGGYYVCNIPEQLEKLSYSIEHEDCVIGVDCPGFKKQSGWSTESMIELASTIISNGYDEWMFNRDGDGWVLTAVSGYGEDTNDPVAGIIRAKYMIHTYHGKKTTVSV